MQLMILNEYVDYQIKAVKLIEYNKHYEYIVFYLVNMSINEIEWWPSALIINQHYLNII